MGIFKTLKTFDARLRSLCQVTRRLLNQKETRQMWLHVPARNQSFVRNLEFVGRTVRGGNIFTGLSPSSTFLFPEKEETESPWASATPSLMFILWLIISIWILPSFPVFSHHFVTHTDTFLSFSFSWKNKH